MNDLGKGMWCGRKIEDMTRNELYEIIKLIDDMRQADHHRHEHDMELLRVAPLRKPWYVRLLGH